MKKEEFESMHAELSSEHSLLEKRVNELSLLRLASFVLSAGSFGYAVFERNLYGVFAGAVLLAVFLYMVRSYNNVEKEMKYKSSRLMVVDGYLDRFGTEWQKNRDYGDTKLLGEQKNPVAVDLDIFGRASLFQYLCFAVTDIGRQSLKDSLSGTVYDVDNIAARQAAVRELSEKPEFVLNLQAFTHILGDNAKKPLGEGGPISKDSSHTFGKLVYINIVAVIVVVSAVLAGLGNEYSLFLFMALTVAQFILAMLTFARHGTMFAPVRRVRMDLNSYEDIFKAIADEQFSSDILNDIKDCITKGASAMEGIRRLNFIGECINLRYNIFGFIFFNGLFMLDYRCELMLDEWDFKYGQSLHNWMCAVGNLEALASLAVPCYVKDTWCFPELFESDKPFFSMKGGKHPLIIESESVSNDFAVSGDTVIITGSNMSGKTTFMRTIGVSLQLAYAGGPVCASNMRASCMRILTSMRVQDDVSQGISTFYAEILRIKDMVEYSEEKRPMIALIDEIFKGTNSADRIIGAREVVRKLRQPWIISIVTTHDFELCDLEHDDSVKAVNYHFSEYYEDNKIYFDYKIKTGRCHTANAQHLMRMAGLLND